MVGKDKRAERRHQKQRAKQRASKMVRQIWCENEEVEEAVIKSADHLKSCRGECCRNPRRCGWNRGKAKLTRQELRADSSFQ